MKKSYLIAAAALIAFGSAVVAQQNLVPQVQIINPTDLFLDVVTGIPSAQSKYATAAQLTSQSGYQVASPISGFQYTFGNSQSFLILTNTGSVTGSVTLAAAPSDGDNVCIYSQGAVGTLTISANTGQTINNAVTSISAASRVCYLYSLASAVWNRSD